MTMEGLMSLFRTQADQDYEAVRAEIGFVTDLQLEIEAAMEKRGLSQARLAKLLGVSEARVSQIMSDNGANLEARTIAKIAYKLGLKATIRFEQDEAAGKGLRNDAICMAEWVRSGGKEGSWGRAVAANENAWSESAHRHERLMAEAR